MNQFTKVVLLIIIVLVISFAITIILYFNMRNIERENMNQALEITNENSKLNDKINEFASQNKILIDNYSIDSNKIGIEVNKNTITSKRVSIVITNNNENQISCSEEFKIQQQIDNNWKYLEYLPHTIWDSIALTINGNSQITKELNIEYYYGKLDEGIYRIVKYIGGTYIYSDEFEIE